MTSSNDARKAKLTLRISTADNLCLNYYFLYSTYFI